MRVRRVAEALALLACAACSGPDPASLKVSSLEPRVLCTEQVGTQVSIHGYPFDSGTKVTLRRPGDVTGGVALRTVEWVSYVEMRVEVTPALMLAPGVYDVEIEQGGTSVTLDAALAAVGPPLIDAITPRPACTAQGGWRATISGSGFMRVGASRPIVMVGGKPATDVDLTGCTTVLEASYGVAVCTGISFTTPADLPSASSYAVAVTSPAPVRCASPAASLTCAP